MQEKNKQLTMQWLSYALFYFCRVNFSIIAPILMAILGFSLMDIGMISTGLLASYAIGQFINGQLNEKHAKWIKLIGMFGSSIMNLLMAASIFPITMAILWILNGFFQSMGWSASVKMTANWFPEKERGKASGILGTSYQIGNVLAWLLTGYLVSFGWQWGFIIPAIMFIVTANVFYKIALQAPEDNELQTIEGRYEAEDRYIGLKSTLKSSLMNWKVWMVAFSLFFLNIVRYGFLTWAPIMLFQLDPNIMSATLKALIFPLVGSIGAITIGFAEKKVKNTSRLAVVFLLILAAIMFVYPTIGDFTAALLCLAIIGFLTYAPHVLIVTRIPMFIGTRKSSASITGFIDGFGYIGASVTSMATVFFTNIGGWSMALNFWAVGAIGSALTLVAIWTHKRKCSIYE